MKTVVIVFLMFFIFVSCNQQRNKDQLNKEIFNTEKSFEKMCVEKGIAEGFYFFADDSAVIKRQNDTLIIGKDNIKNYYANDFYKKASVLWTPDFIDVSDDGSMAYTYGKYIWTVNDDNGSVTEFKGVFHTVWKRQKDNSWKYVWD
jgi:ketosteroid isomerase-like protein